MMSSRRSCARMMEQLGDGCIELGDYLYHEGYTSCMNWQFLEKFDC